MLSILVEMPLLMRFNVKTSLIKKVLLMELEFINTAQLSAMSNFGKSSTLSIFSLPSGSCVLCCQNDTNQEKVFLLATQRGKLRQFRTLDAAAKVALSSRYALMLTFVDDRYTPIEILRLSGADLTDYWHDDGPIVTARLDCGRIAGVSLPKEGTRPSDFIGKHVRGSYTTESGEKGYITGVIEEIIQKPLAE